MDTHVEANTNDQRAGNRKGIVALYSLTAYAPVDFGIVPGMHQFDTIAVLEEIDDPPPFPQPATDPADYWLPGLLIGVTNC